MAKEILTERLLQRCTTGSVLNLQSFQLDNNDIDFICWWLTKNTHIKTLDVRFNSIGNDGAIALAGNQTLTTLNVRDNNIEEAGKQALLRMRTNPTRSANQQKQNGCCTAPALAILCGYQIMQRMQKTTKLTELIKSNKLPAEAIKELPRPAIKF